MITALFTAATGMQAQQLNTDIIANNLANVNTSGFKRSRADFQDLFYQTIREVGVQSSPDTTVPTGLQVGLGVRPAASQKLFLQGDLQQTGNTLDLAIEGDGFFQIEDPNGTIAYTRSGAFKRDSQGRVTTSDGYLLSPTITIPQDALSVSISADGTVSISTDPSQPPQQIGNIELARFLNPSGLTSVGRNLYFETSSSGAPLVGTPGEAGYGTLSQGFLELSNVSIVEEMVQMIIGQRAYELNSRAIRTADEMLALATNLRR